MKTMLNTIRIERDFSITWRHNGRAVGWGGAKGLADRLRNQRENRQRYQLLGSREYILDLSRMPRTTAAANAHLEAALVVQEELSKFTPEEWEKWVLPDPAVVAARAALEQAQLRLSEVAA
jgi:hypothetical protein